MKILKGFEFGRLIKKSICLISIAAMLTSCVASAENLSKQALPTTSKIFVNGHEVYINGYNVEDNNYFKLRDLAAVLANTECEFKVSYDELSDTITMTRGEHPENLYVLAEENSGTKIANNTSSRIIIDGAEISPKGYNIEYNNYFKLRDMGGVLNFNVEWNEHWNSIYITTNSTELDYNSYREQVSYFEELNQVVYLVNSERAKCGLPPLTWDLQLTKAAVKRSEEIVDVFSHTRPNGEECFTVFKEFGITYMTAGENVAIGQNTAEKVVDGWMNSKGHRENILSNDFGKIGVGAVKVRQGSYQGFAWTQLFTD